LKKYVWSYSVLRFATKNVSLKSVGSNRKISRDGRTRCPTK
jgi:hypothetical protein